MPNHEKSRFWAFRITAPWEYIESKVPVMMGWFDYERHAIGYHNGARSGNAHAHIVLELKGELQKQSFDVRAKKAFLGEEAKGNKVYSSKIWDKSLKAVSYLFHDKGGKVDVSHMKLTAQDVNEVSKLDELYTEIKEDGKARASNKMVDKILAEIAISKHAWDDRRILHRIYAGVSLQEWHSPGDSKIMQYLDDIMLRQGTAEDQESARAEFVDRILARRRR